MASHSLGVRLESHAVPQNGRIHTYFQTGETVSFGLEVFLILYSSSDTEFKILSMSSHL